MTTKNKLKIEQVLRNNPQQPVVIVGEYEANTENSIFLVAETDERELHIPSGWHLQLEEIARQDKAYLVIGNLDEVDYKKQEQFVGLLKDRRAGNYKLPMNVQIIMPITDKNRLSDKICSLSLVWDMKQ